MNKRSHEIVSVELIGRPMTEADRKEAARRLAKIIAPLVIQSMNKEKQAESQPAEMEVQICE